MPKAVLNSALRSLRGTVDGIVYKHYQDKRGLVVSRMPDMSKVKPSAAQLAQRKAMKRAGEFHRQVLADPKLLKHFQQIAKKQRINLSAATMGAALRSQAAKLRRDSKNSPR